MISKNILLKNSCHLKVVHELVFWFMIFEKWSMNFLKLFKFFQKIIHDFQKMFMIF
jgi:hypothetical protein